MSFFIYWDASALVKRYAPESGTPAVNRIFSEVPPERMLALGLAVGEVVSIFVRKRNAGLIPEEAFSQALATFRAEVIDSPFRLLSVEDRFLFDSLPLIVRHSLNATDALVLRSALEQRGQLAEGEDLVLVASDLRLLRAAQLEGVATFNPETDPTEALETLLGRRTPIQEEEGEPENGDR